MQSVILCLFLSVFNSICCSAFTFRPEGKAWIYLLIYAPTLTFTHKLRVMTKRMKLQILAAEISFLCADRLGSSDSLILYLSS